LLVMKKKKKKKHNKIKQGKSYIKRREMRGEATQDRNTKKRNLGLPQEERKT